ncbi:type III secretion protein V [Natronocella acetinitrilica]|uniref:Type III secretion protein V n=1 Tax=Natronocella acetinitrilica TaxID=414046 RepID=A0AAE3KCQ8_9GAMM|nr:type III secretion system export apparatus subunit SctV [Natronocella acetinitrilica]MCP1675303.1 type III secretion protein V [Natronocella acetinitrilica]
MSLDRVEPLVQSALKRNDAVLALLLVLTVSMIILPMPTTLVDTLIALNLAVSAVLIMVAIYIPSPLAFSSFPAVLLLTTLFRLALSITTTRLILLQADAGQVVDTFGNFVVGGNVIVGLVIFLIITVVQFIVVTKGAERVAEVSARFSLDALPGKQMSIDGDMRAGVIDLDQARQRRKRLEKESQLYGSLDGAMKFVKGDAIAGIFITLINIIGGISVGALQHGLSTGEAVQVYTVLTVGDGLVAQIPALLIAMTAGIIVTRVATSDSTNLGEDIGRQIFAQPMALMIASGLLFGFSLVPGFPTLVFVTLGALLGLVGLVLHRVARRDRDDEGAFLDALSARAGQADDPDEKSPRELPRASALLVTLDANLQARLDHAALNDAFAGMRRRLYMEMGVPGAGAQLRYVDGLGEYQYTISVHEVPVGRGELRPGCLMVARPPSAIRALGIEPVEQQTPNQEYCWVRETDRALLIEKDQPYLTHSQVLARHLSVILEVHASELMGIQEAKKLLDGMIPDAVELSKEAAATIPLPILAETLKRLLAEQVPIRNLAIILETMLKFIQESKEPSFLSEHCRRALKRQISHRFSQDGILMAVMLAPDAEDVARRLHSGEVTAAQRQALMSNLEQAVKAASRERGKVVILVSGEFRQPLREAVRRDLPRTPVLSFEDLSDEVQIRPLERVGLTPRVEATESDSGGGGQ